MCDAKEELDRVQAGLVHLCLRAVTSGAPYVGSCHLQGSGLENGDTSIGL